MDQLKEFGLDEETLKKLGEYNEKSKNLSDYEKGYVQGQMNGFLNGLTAGIVGEKNDS